MAINQFEHFLKENKIEDIKIIVSTETTHTAQQAADVHGVPVSNIVKSLLVVSDESFTLFLVPGDKRLDMEIVSSLVDGDDCRMANADEVKKITGYSIGGVPPFGHDQKLPTYIVDGFDREQMLVAAAGAHNGVFKITYDRLVELSEAIQLSNEK